MSLPCKEGEGAWCCWLLHGVVRLEQSLMGVTTAGCHPVPGCAGLSCLLKTTPGLCGVTVTSLLYLDESFIGLPNEYKLLSRATRVPHLQQHD